MWPMSQNMACLPMTIGSGNSSFNVNELAIIIPRKEGFPVFSRISIQYLTLKDNVLVCDRTRLNLAKKRNNS